MTPVSAEIIEAAIAIIGAEGIQQEQVEKEVRALVADDMTARRLIDWIPEAFGTVLVSHISTRIIPPKSFRARSSSGKWIEFPFTSEPIFAAALVMAQQIFHEGQRHLFQNIASQSAVVNTVNSALHAGAKLDGAVLSGPALIGIPAEVYPIPHRPSLLQRLFGR